MITFGSPVSTSRFPVLVIRIPPILSINELAPIKVSENTKFCFTSCEVSFFTVPRFSTIDFDSVISPPFVLILIFSIKTHHWVQY